MTGFTPKTIRVYREETGSVLNEWNTCHLFPRLMVLDADGEEYLLESCIYCRGDPWVSVSADFLSLHHTLRGDNFLCHVQGTDWFNPLV